MEWDGGGWQKEEVEIALSPLINELISMFLIRTFIIEEVSNSFFSFDFF